MKCLSLGAATLKKGRGKCYDCPSFSLLALWALPAGEKKKGFSWGYHT